MNQEEIKPQEENQKSSPAITLEELQTELKKINKKKAAEEIYWWLKENINNYIDTHQTSYSLSFLAHEEMMPEMAKIEHLCTRFNAVEFKMGDGETFETALEREDVTEEGMMQECINDFMEEIRESMEKNKKKSEELFKLLSNFYEVVGFYKKSPLIKELKGYIKVEYLSFENMELDLTKTPLVPVLDDEGKIVNYRRDESKTETISKMPPAFTIDFGIEMWENKGETSLF